MDRPDTPHPLYRDTMEELLRSYSSDSLGTLTYRLPTRATEEAPPAQSPESLRPVPSTSTESETRPHHIPSPTRRHVSSRVRKSVQTVKAWYKGKKRVWKDRRVCPNFTVAKVVFSSGACTDSQTYHGTTFYSRRQLTIKLIRYAVGTSEASRILTRTKSARSC